MKLWLFISRYSEETKLILHWCTNMSTISSLLNNFQTYSSVWTRFDRLLKASKSLHFHSFPHRGQHIPVWAQIVLVAGESIRRLKGCSGCLQGRQWFVLPGWLSAAQCTGSLRSEESTLTMVHSRGDYLAVTTHTNNKKAPFFIAVFLKIHISLSSEGSLMPSDMVSSCCSLHATQLHRRHKSIGHGLTSSGTTSWVFFFTK